MTLPAPLATADFLAQAVALAEPRDVQATDCPPGTHCRVTGRPIERGYRIMDIVTDANTEFIDQFRGDVGGFVSENAARCYKSAAPKDKHTVRPSWGFPERTVANPCAKSHLAVQVDGEVEYVSPAFDPVTALANETLSWSVAARQAWERYAGHNCFILLTPDFKRRLWPYARTGILGQRTPVYVLNKGYNLDGQFFADWGRLVNLLDVVEMVMAEGYSKASILDSLLSAPSSTLEKVGAQSLEKQAGEKPEAYKSRCLTWGRLQAAETEKVLRPLRDELEFKLAVMMAVRTLTPEETEKALKKKQAEREAVADEKAAKKSKKAALTGESEETA